MDDGRNMSSIGTQDGIIVKPLEPNEHSSGRSDLMTRRLKNRERQRRYRARKRLEADMKKGSVSIQSTRPQGDAESNGNHNYHISRIHCKRNWKKDARKAHTSKNVEQEFRAANTENQAHFLANQVAVEAEVERKKHVENLLGSETKAKLGARNWKAEARRKNN